MPNFIESPNAIALNSLNQPVSNGAKRTRAGWQRWGNRRLTVTDKRLGFKCVVGYFQDSYYRVSFAAMPLTGQRRTLAGRLVGE